MTLVDDLKAAKALIDTPEKWVKGTYEKDGCRCLLGALIDSTHDFGSYGAAQRAVKAEIDDVQLEIAGFNDLPSTTHSDVMRVLDGAIAAAEASAP